jgi:hypothetical protein
MLTRIIVSLMVILPYCVSLRKNRQRIFWLTFAGHAGGAAATKKGASRRARVYFIVTRVPDAKVVLNTASIYGKAFGES